MSETRERLAEAARIIEDELGYTNGWKVPDDQYQEHCRRAAERVAALLRQPPEREGDVAGQLRATQRELARVAGLLHEVLARPPSHPSTEPGT